MKTKTNLTSFILLGSSTMQRSLIFAILLTLFNLATFAQNWKYLQNKTYTHAEIISEYQKLANQHRNASLQVYGKTDAGTDLHLFQIGKYQPGKTVLLINNAIHPGEPCGVDASLKLAYELLTDKKKSKILDKVMVCIVPMYNVGGALLRDKDIRINQDGPEAYGSRGNAKNLDLNRDFIKCDSKNAQAFSSLFYACNPDVFVDVHTTNGYDYQYSLGLLNTHLDKIHPSMRPYFEDEVLPGLYGSMKKKGKEITPYIYGKGKIPEDGLKTFLDSPRYSTGYANLFNVFGFITEAHKYKPYKDRVEYSYEFLNSILDWMQKDGKSIIATRAKANYQAKIEQNVPIHWKEDTSVFVDRTFKGYEAKYETSKLTGAERLYYDQSQPFEKTIKYYNKYNTDITIRKPEYYIIPSAWSDVIDRLKWNKVNMIPLKKDTTITVETYFIDSYETVKTPFEGHYLHYDVKVTPKRQTWNYKKGDYLIPTNQTRNRFIIETLEPQAHDSYFCWNFFDNIMQQKEWFSSFAFEKTAIEILKKDPELTRKLNEKKKAEPDFAKNHVAQLDYIHRNSRYMDRRYMRYPVGRIFFTR